MLYATTARPSIRTSKQYYTCSALAHNVQSDIGIKAVRILGGNQKNWVDSRQPKLMSGKRHTPLLALCGACAAGA